MKVPEDKDNGDGTHMHYALINMKEAFALYKQIVASLGDLELPRNVSNETIAAAFMLVSGHFLARAGAADVCEVMEACVKALTKAIREGTQS